VGGAEQGDGKASPRRPTGRGNVPELADESTGDDAAPACWVAEGLERQSLLVNRVLASHALSRRFDLIGRGSIRHAGAVINLASGHAVPIPLPHG